jgi:hypothetical protein
MYVINTWGSGIYVRIGYYYLYFDFHSNLGHRGFREQSPGICGMQTEITQQQLIKHFFSVLELELRAFTLSHSISPFLWRVFQDRVLQTVCLGWFRTTILHISASWVARREPPEPGLLSIFHAHYCISRAQNYPSSWLNFTTIYVLMDRGAEHSRLISHKGQLNLR